MESAFEWKQFYAAELARMGDGAIDGLLDAAEAASRDAHEVVAWVVPHTRAEISGSQLATTAAEIVASGRQRVLALGVLHGGRRTDADTVSAARAGDQDAIETIRGVHTEDGLAAEEFSLDAVTLMLHRAAERQGRSIEVVRRYPFLVGSDPASLPGLDELVDIWTTGAALLVTTDPMHHGIGYGTPRSGALDRADPRTMQFATSAIEAQFDALANHRFYEFEALTKHHRSDFRDTGPIMAALLGTGWQATIHELTLVDYTEALKTEPPTWVAASRTTIHRP